jgi:hypothetical protein
MKVKGVRLESRVSREGQKRRTRVSDTHGLCRGQVFQPAAFSEQHNSRVKEAAGDAGADGDKITLASEHFHLAGARELG